MGALSPAQKRGRDHAVGGLSEKESQYATAGDSLTPTVAEGIDVCRDALQCVSTPLSTTCHPQRHAMTLFKDRYRVESARLKGWDYSAAGYYFVTICTRNRECWLGEVIDGIMRLSSVGEVVAEEWLKTSQMRDNVRI